MNLLKRQIVMSILAILKPHCPPPWNDDGSDVLVSNKNVTHIPLLQPDHPRVKNNSLNISPRNSYYSVSLLKKSFSTQVQ